VERIKCSPAMEQIPTYDHSSCVSR
jgi:hypothetical protein